MAKATAHNCSKDKVKPILHKFKLKLNKRMREEVDFLKHLKMFKMEK